MSVRVLQGHVVDVLAGEPAGSIHTVCTSPPYLWLRSYGTEPQTWPDGWVGELGQEPTPEEYVEHLCAVMDAVGRVLRDDGTLWVNLAGCYYNDPGGQNTVGGARPKNGTGPSTLSSASHKLREVAAISAKAVEANRLHGRQKRGRHPWLKELDWIDVPGLFANAMQRRGWIWRSDVTWAKPSPLPESAQGWRWERCRVKTEAGPTPRRGDPAELGGYPAHGHGSDGGPTGGTAKWTDCSGCPNCKKTGGLILRTGNGRPTKSTEAILLFIKQPGAYYDVEAVREPVSAASLRDGRTARGQRGTRGEYGAADGNCGFNPAGRNLRDLWTISPEPLKAEAGESEHYAAYPSALPARCIQAGTSGRGCCPSCGAPWARVIERTKLGEREKKHEGYAPLKDTGNHATAGFDGNGMRYDTDYTLQTTTVDWRATCPCPAREPVPCRVLDPFGGSGTTAIAADRLGRDAILVELKPSYADLARRRITRDAPLLTFGAVSAEGELAAAEAPPGAKQASHPNRTVAGFNARWDAKERAPREAAAAAPEAAG